MREEETYKGWTIKYTGMSIGGICTYVARKEGFNHIGGTSIAYVKKCIDYESNK